MTFEERPKGGVRKQAKKILPVLKLTLCITTLIVLIKLNYRAGGIVQW